MTEKKKSGYISILDLAYGQVEYHNGYLVFDILHLHDYFWSDLVF